jgi:hypothetical protein
MQEITVDKDIKLLYVTADSFPDGIKTAFDKLQGLLASGDERKYYGISRPEKGNIIYKAAAEEKYSGEAEQLNCDTLVLKKGKYISSEIPDFMNNIPAIGGTFQEMLMRPDIDPEGCCIEVYSDNKDARCIVRLKQ